MGFHCISCSSDKSISHMMKNAKVGDLISIACCKNCRLVQIKNVPNEQNFLKFYKSKYRIEYRKQDRPILKHVDRARAQAVPRLKKIAPFIRENTKLLDIGSGGGEFTYLASRMGTVASGIDASSAYLEFGKNHYSINVEQKKISQVLDAKLYQVVIMFNVLDHLPNPLKVIRKVLQIIKIGGSFVRELANLVLEAISPFYRFFKAHICYLISLSLRGSLKDNFSVEYIENKNVISLFCQKSNAKKFKKHSDCNPSAVGIEKSRLKCKNLQQYILNGALFKVLKKYQGRLRKILLARQGS